MLQGTMLMPRVSEILTTTWGKIFAFVGVIAAIFGIYKLAVEIRAAYLATTPEVHPFAAISDFASFPLSIKNASGMFDIKVGGITCLMENIQFSDPNIQYKNNYIMRQAPSDLILRPGDLPMNMLFPLVGGPLARIRVDQIVAVRTRVTFNYAVGLFGHRLWGDNLSRAFTWKGGKWIEGEIY